MLLHPLKSSTKDSQESDSCRKTITSLDNAIGDRMSVMRTPEKSLSYCYSLVQLLDAEYATSCEILFARVNYDAFQVRITHGDQARASVFARRSYQSRLVCEGEDNNETQQMTAFMNRPNSHRNFRQSGKWRTAIGQVPTELSKAEFEDWFWRAGK